MTTENPETTTADQEPFAENTYQEGFADGTFHGQKIEQLSATDPTAGDPPADEPTDAATDDGKDQTIDAGDLVVIKTDAQAAYGEQFGYGVVLETLEYDDAEGETIAGARVIPLPAAVVAPLADLERF